MRNQLRLTSVHSQRPKYLPHAVGLLALSILAGCSAETLEMQESEATAPSVIN
jgi:hypothetical protein